LPVGASYQVGRLIVMGRFGSAWKAFWVILREPEKEAAWERFHSTTVEEETEEADEESKVATGVSPDAVYTLTLLQREGRLVDFLLEDIDQYADAQIGAAVRQIHGGCRRVLENNFGVKPIRGEAEGNCVEIPPGFDPVAIRLTGNVSGEPPFAGTLQHRGWRVTKVDFPRRHVELDPWIIQPAEVEI
jgi:hypothetical protein